ncbi:hypothetical protein [uncultured Amaricoccus sp.]|uniref:hypothetical protein n=1 Tax=uncultured Amaricoccus sp. TaxID=339341 RepID=UPI00261672E3|nr:hypothetical protein [uncultured Amaricoccus sp.]
MWITVGENDDLILKEIEGQTDRAAALIAQSYLEDRLVLAIKARLICDDVVLRRVFTGAGPAASFSARIDLGLLLGIYRSEIHKLLTQIKDIRNTFAHKAEPLSFETATIRDRCNNLDVERAGTFVTKDGESETFDVSPSGNPRLAFLNAIKFLLFICDRELRLHPPRKPAPPVVTLWRGSSPAP